MKWKDYVWPAIGLAAVALSAWLLYEELRGISVSDIGDGLAAISLHRWLLAALATIVAYAALAGYDHIALLHIGKKVPWLFISLCSFTTYALSHNIGGSVISGAVVRYRAYGSKGLTTSEVAILVAVCWFTFILATVAVAGAALILEPRLMDRYFEGTLFRWRSGSCCSGLSRSMSSAVGCISIHCTYAVSTSTIPNPELSPGSSSSVRWN